MAEQRLFRIVEEPQVTDRLGPLDATAIGGMVIITARPERFPRQGTLRELEQPFLEALTALKTKYPDRQLVVHEWVPSPVACPRIWRFFEDHGVEMALTPEVRWFVEQLGVRL